MSFASQVHKWAPFLTRRLSAARGRIWRARNPYRDEGSEWYANGGSEFTLGIINEFWHLHWPYIAACRDLGVSYKVLDISRPDWLEVLGDSGCDAFVCWPSVQYKPWKEMFDERLKAFSLVDNRIVYPNLESLWIWESKRRMNYWLSTHDVPHPMTWVFHEEEAAQRFVSECHLPVVFKSDMGSGASGVHVFQDRGSLRRHTRRCFSRGYTTSRRFALDREHGSVVFQEYLSDVREWRVVRIGDSFFAYEKAKKGEFHSGSKEFLYGRPSDELLDLARQVSEQGGFDSIDIDVFVTPDGRMFINELQALFGQSGSREICRVDGDTGRMVWNDNNKTWEFDPGTYCMNYMCNLRVKSLLSRLSKQR